jgi:RHS repeat-associated protein
MSGVVGVAESSEFDVSVVQALPQARYYDSGKGEFLSEDPVFLGDPKQQVLTDPQSLNSYSYANDNPITNSDAKGLWSISYNLAGIGAEEGFGLFAGGTASLSMSFVWGRDGGFALTRSAAGTGGYSQNSVSYPASPNGQQPFIYGLFMGAGCSYPCGGNLNQYGVSFSPTVSRLDDLNGPADSMNFNYEGASFSRQVDASGNVTYGGSYRGIAKGASVSTYPVNGQVIWSLKTSSVANVGNRAYQSVMSAASSTYQSAVARIQSQVASLKAQVAQLVAASGH